MIDLENIRNYSIPFPEGGWALLGRPHHFAELPETHREQFIFLNKTAEKYLNTFTGPSANLLSGDLWDPFAKGNFKHVEEFTDFYWGQESKLLLKKWLYKRGIPFQRWVFILPDGPDVPVLTTWKMLVKYSDLIFITDTMVFDHTLNWCLFNFHEDHMFFGRDKIYDPKEDEQMMERLNERKKQFPQFKHPYL